MQNKNRKVKNAAANSFDKTTIVKILSDQIHRGFQEPPVELRGFLWRLGTPPNPSLSPEPLSLHCLLPREAGSERRLRNARRPRAIQSCSEDF